MARLFAMDRALLLWDIDGTLLLTDGAGMRGMARASRKLYGDSFRWDGVRTSGRLDPVIFADALGRNGLPLTDDGHRVFHDTYIVELEAELELVGEGARTLPGSREAIATLLQRSATRQDVVQGLVTGNYRRAAPLKLRACGLDPAWFEINAFGDEGKTRPDLVALAMKRCTERFGRAPDPRNVIVIGDTPFDVDCAHAHGCIAFAVATGLHDIDELRSTGADFVVRDLSDPTPLFALLDDR